MAVQYYSQTRLGQLLGSEGAAHLTSEGLAPCVQGGQEILYDAPYVDQLIARFCSMALDGPVRYDPAFARLFHIERLHKEYLAQDWSGKGPGEKPLAARKIIAQAQALVAAGEAVLLAQLAARSPDTIEVAKAQAWTTKGVLVGVKIGRIFYYSAAYADQVVWAMTQCETVSAAAQRLGVTRSVLQRRAEAVNIHVFVGPDGRPRIDAKRVPLG